MKALTRSDIELIVDMLKRCVDMNDFIAETVSQHFDDHRVSESLQAVIDRLDQILRASLQELTGENMFPEEATND